MCQKEVIYTAGDSDGPAYLPVNHIFLCFIADFIQFMSFANKATD